MLKFEMEPRSFVTLQAQHFISPLLSVSLCFLIIRGRGGWGGETDTGAKESEKRLKKEFESKYAVFEQLRGTKANDAPESQELSSLEDIILK